MLIAFVDVCDREVLVEVCHIEETLNKAVCGWRGERGAGFLVAEWLAAVGRPRSQS